MKQVCIITGGRSFLGVENGMYRHIPAEILGARTLEHLLEKAEEQFNPEAIDGILAGNGVGGGGNIARLMMLEAGLPRRISAVTVDGE